VNSAKRSNFSSVGEEAPFKYRPLTLLLACAGLAGAINVYAADAASDAGGTPGGSSKAETGPVVKSLDGITVHGRNREEKLQDVPISMSVVGGEELERFNSYDLTAISKRVANVSWNFGNQRTSSLSIRGIGKIGQTEAQDPSVGLVVDGVPWAYNALSSSFDFIDLDSVEVARGPQGTLLGKNTSMGAIILNRKGPSFTPSIDYSVTFEDRNGVVGTLAATGPVVDNLLAYRATFNVDHENGALHNILEMDQTFTNTNRVAARLQFLLTPSDNFNARLSFEVQPNSGEFTNSATIQTATPATYANGAPTTTAKTNPDNGYILATRSWFTNNASINPANYYNTNGGTAVELYRPQPLTTGSHSGTAELNWLLPRDYKLTSITAYKDYYFDAVNDAGTPFNITGNSGGYLINYRQNSEELRLSSPVGGFVDFQTGLYLINVKNSVDYQVGPYGADAGAFYASNSQYATLDANAAGQLLMINSLNNLSVYGTNTGGTQLINNYSAALFGQANWHFSDALTLTTGLRATRENRTNVGSTIITGEGNGAALNPVAVNGVPLGGFATSNVGALLASNNAQQVALANAVALEYFGVANYANLSAAQQKQVYAAQQVRLAKLGVLFPQTAAQPFKATQPSWVLSPSYKLDDNQTAYLSIQHGEKAGIAQFYNGQSYLASPEKTDSFELGLKQSLLNRTLTVNADVFLTNISNYQQAVRLVDQYTTNLNVQNGVSPSTAYGTITGNVPKVRVSGLEVDGQYAGIPFTVLRFSGAYNNATYKQFSNDAQPVENGYPGAPAYRDVSGATLPGAAKWSGNLGADYRRPWHGEYDFHLSSNIAYSSSFNSDTSLSSYAVVPHSWIVDWSVGAGRRDRGFDFSLFVKNLFNDSTPLARTWNSYTPGLPRTFGIQIVGKI